MNDHRERLIRVASALARVEASIASLQRCAELLSTLPTNHPAVEAHGETYRATLRLEVLLQSTLKRLG